MIALLAFAFAADADVDAVDLASLLVRDGHYDRAKATLAEVDVAEVDAVRFYTLTGLIAVEEQAHRDAVSAFENALTAGAVDPTLRVYLASEYLQVERPTDALAVLAGTEALAASWVLHSRAHTAIGDPDAAYEALWTGAEAFPTDIPIARSQAIFLAERGLTQDALRAAEPVLAHGATLDVLAIAAPLRSTDPHAAVTLLHAAALRFPDDRDVPVHLAAAWIADGVPAAAGAILLIAAQTDPTLFVPAANALGEAGQHDRALYVNSLVTDPVEKARQRLGLLVAAGRFDEALALRDRLDRLGLLTVDRVAYAVAFAAFQVGDYRLADASLRGVSDPDIFALATDLRQAMSTCQEAPWTCR